MAETSNVNCDNLEIRGNLGNMLDTEEMVKTEEDVVVKTEPVECAVCVSRAREGVELRSAVTAASGSTVLAFLGKYTPLDLEDHVGLKYVCKGCYDLINLLEQAELEYLKLKEAFEAIINKNPMFECGAPPVPPVPLDSVKNELVSLADNLELDSEDEPLARTKKKRTTKLVKKKKKLKTVSKQKKESQDKDRWLYDVSDSKEHIEVEVNQLTGTVDIKTEDAIDAEQSQSPFNNGTPNGLDDGFGDFDDNDDDRDNNFVPEEAVEERKRAGRRTAAKEVHPCDQCSMQYTSAVRLERHKSKKHDGSKPPYICEVCGAHYKHKRACDIHIQLHKGISDWKCEECNKLFPSKNALQRHNNIHTGKLNYQCDLCGKSFIHTSSFKMHKLSHSGVKSHACDVCGLALMTRSHLKRHKRIHSGEKRHECGVCGKRFSERYNLAAHSKSHDAGEAPEGARRRLFRCPYCGERFERRYMLERHAAAEHGRALERPPPTPRNTMSKLLKAQAAARARPKEPAWPYAPDFLRPADYPH